MWALGEPCPPAGRHRRVGGIRKIVTRAKGAIACARNESDPQSGVAFEAVENFIELTARGGI